MSILEKIEILTCKLFPYEQFIRDCKKKGLVQYSENKVDKEERDRMNDIIKQIQNYLN